MERGNPPLPEMVISAYYHMPTTTVKLDKKRSAMLTRWARRGKVSKSDVIRALIDRVGPIETGDDLIEWVNASAGKGLGLAQQKKL